ncbi:hypothetical protein BY458DRAFT_507235 [Sporodiniella umbellata]|nr:hypothetical protein BY458DRAFT_507235 [Sporodiniella umbellata]
MDCLHHCFLVPIVLACSGVLNIREEDKSFIDGDEIGVLFSLPLKTRTLIGFGTFR